MALPQHPKCARAFPRRLRTPYDAACFSLPGPDAARRHASSVPGPLEGRRRTGRMRMGLVAGADSSLPMGKMYNGVDLTNWKWKPPGTRGADGLVTARPKKLWETVLDWLLPNTAMDTDAGNTKKKMGVSAKAPAVDKIRDLASVQAEAEALAEVSSAVQDLLGSPASILNFALDALLKDASLDHYLEKRPNFTSFCSSLRKALVTSEVPDETLCVIIKSILNSVETTYGAVAPAAAMAVRSSLLLHTVDGVSAHPTRYGKEVWLLLFDLSSQSRVESKRLMRELMTHVPDEHIRPATTAIVKLLDFFFIGMGDLRVGANLERHANTTAKSLRKLGAAQHQHVLVAATEQLMSHSRSTVFDKQRLAWLSIVARLPDVGRDLLGRICALTEAGSAPPLLHWEICGVFLGWLNSHHTLKQKAAVYRSLTLELDPGSHQGALPTQFYSNLSAKLWKTKQAHHIRCLCQFLYDLGRDQDVLLLVRGFRNLVKNEASPFANLATGLRHPQLAMDILLCYSRSRRVSKHFWKTTFAQDAMQLIVDTNSTDGKKLSAELGILAHRRRRPLSKDRIGKAVRLASAVVRASNLRPRVKYRRLMDIIKFFQFHRTRIPSRVLQDLILLITTDLVEGKPGRATRMRSAVQLVARAAGPGAALNVGQKLMDWRESVIQARARMRARG